MILPLMEALSEAVKVITSHVILSSLGTRIVSTKLRELSSQIKSLNE